MKFMTTAELVQQGFSKHEIRSMAADGRIVRVARGHYRCVFGSSEQDPGRLPQPAHDRTTAEIAHLALAKHFDHHVLAAESSALLHDLPLHVVPAQVQVLRDGSGSTWRRSGYDVLSGPLPAAQVIDIEGRRTTSIARTVVDVARLRGVIPGLVVWEAARWRARKAEHLTDFDRDVDDCLELLWGRLGIRHARQVRELASAFSQSPMETRSRWQLIQLGVPAFVQQFEVFSAEGESLGTTDFGWPEYGVLGEYDGQDKYDRLARPGESPPTVMRREKRRQEGMEAEGWVFARWGKEEVARPQLLQRRLEKAFTVAAGRTGVVAGDFAKVVPRSIMPRSITRVR